MIFLFIKNLIKILISRKTKTVIIKVKLMIYEKLTHWICNEKNSFTLQKLVSLIIN